MELSEVENMYIFHIMKMEAKIRECATFFFAAEFITLREPGTEEGQLLFSLFHGAKSLIFRCRFQGPDCPWFTCQVGTGRYCQMHFHSWTKPKFES